jgi:hypothetical protein
MFLISPSRSFYICTLIDAYNRSALGDAATMDLLQSLDLRFTSRYFSSTIHNIHIPRTVPFLSASGMYGYFTSLSLSLCLVRRLSCSIISQMRGSHSQILMWLLALSLHASHHKPRPFAPSIRPPPTLVAVPLFPVSYMHIRKTLSHPIHIDAPAWFHSPLP